MKILTYISLFAFPFCVSAQNYAPFNQLISKRFYNINNISEDSHYFHADSVSQIGDTTYYHNYRPIIDSSWDLEPGDDCQFWGGVVYVLDTNRFTGNTVRFNSSANTLVFANHLSENIQFNFSLGINDSSLIYEDSTYTYWLKLTAETIETFWDQTDSVKIFTILQYDHLNNAVNSEIHNYTIRLSKNHGLLSFLTVYSFPQAVKLLDLKGQTNPAMGAYSIRYEDLYPYQVGDILQYKGSASGSSTSFGYGWLLTSYEVTSREETADSVKIYFSYFTAQPPIPFPGGGSWATYGYHLPNPLIYPKNKFYVEIPTNHKNVPASGKPIFINENISTHCNISNDDITIGEKFVSFCDSCLCFGGADGYGSYVSSRSAVKNIGITWGNKIAYNWMDNINYSFNLIYFKIGNYECGERQYLNNTNLHDPVIKIYPNPAEKYIIIESPLNYKKIILKNMLGQEFNVAYTHENNSYKLSLDDLPSGDYFLNLTYESQVQVKLIVKQ